MKWNKIGICRIFYKKYLKESGSIEKEGDKIIPHQEHI